jgi:hypothetical protein
MPYNTRRKSLSLPSLGIHIPVTHAARAAAASKAAARSSSASFPSTSSSSSATPSTSVDRSASPESHPSKRLKRSHVDNASDNAIAIEQTPPPSPPAGSNADMTEAAPVPKIDLEGINDDIVEAVIVQLQSTGNRPHLVKELEMVLAQQLTSVQQ